MKLPLLLLLFLTACTYTLPDGRKYKLHATCVSGHYEVEYHEEMREKHFSLVKTYEVVRWVDSTYICDKFRDDTIWVK